MKISLVLLALLVLQVSDVYGATFGEAIKTENVYGKPVNYCEYGKLKVLPNSMFKDYEACMKCLCTSNGLKCDSINPVVTVPEDSICVSVSIGCKNIWVLRDNNNARCPKKLMPDTIAVAGK